MSPQSIISLNKKNLTFFFKFCCVLLFVMTAGYSVFWIIHENVFLAYTCIITSILSIIMYFYHQLRIPLRTASLLLVTGASACIFFATAANWYYTSVFLSYFVIIPLGTLILLGRTWSIIWAILCTIQLLVIPYISQYLTVKMLYNSQTLLMIQLSQVVALMLIVIAIGFVFEKLSNTLIENLLIKKVELEETQKNLLHTQRVKNRFFSSISHEIRTPLNAIRGIAELLSSDKDMSENNAILVHSLNRSSAHLLAIINDLLDLGKLEENKLRLTETDYELRETIYEAYNIVRLAAGEKRLDFSLQIDASLPRFIHGDPNRLRQVLVNLLNNAIKFTAKGHVKLECINIQSTIAPAWMEVRIEDSGIGISEAAQQTIFEGFTQAHDYIASQYGGSGLGLSISKKLIELHGGRIWLKSEVGVGSTFYFRIPLHPVFTESLDKIDEEKADRERAILNVDEVPQIERILLVEDNSLNVLIAKKLLERHFPTTQIEIAENGQIAVEKLKNGLSVDIVLMDIHMPVMDGISATKIIRSFPEKQFKKLPIMAMTANTGEEDIKNCIQAGMNDFISKPFDISILVLKIRNLVGNNPN